MCDLYTCLRKKQPKPVDLSEVLDFKSILESYDQNAELPRGIVPVLCGLDRPVFCLENRPGINLFLLTHNNYLLQALLTMHALHLANFSSKRYMSYML